MATKASTAEYLVDQLGDGVTCKKMFGEYGLYLDGKMFALICDDQLFLKATAGGRALLGEVAEAPPYPGAKLAFVIPGDRWDDAEWLAELAAVTTRELPAPKPKRPPGAGAKRARGGAQRGKREGR